MTQEEPPVEVHSEQVDREEISAAEMSVPSPPVDLRGNHCTITRDQVDRGKSSTTEQDMSSLPIDMRGNHCTATRNQTVLMTQVRPSMGLTKEPVAYPFLSPNLLNRAPSGFQEEKLRAGEHRGTHYERGKTQNTVPAHGNAAIHLTGKRVLLTVLSMSYSDKLTSTTTLIARLIIGWNEDQDTCKRVLRLDDLKKAEQVMFLLSQQVVRRLLQSGELDYLDPTFTNQGIIVTKYRLGEGNKAILGQNNLAILTPHTRLAHLIMMAAH